jgi:hypothetical protein
MLLRLGELDPDDYTTSELLESQPIFACAAKKLGKENVVHFYNDLKAIYSRFQFEYHKIGPHFMPLQVKSGSSTKISFKRSVLIWNCFWKGRASCSSNFLMLRNISA